MIRVSVTYDVVTEASAVDGDHADHGYIDPRDESRRSYARGGKRVVVDTREDDGLPDDAYAGGFADNH